MDTWRLGGDVEFCCDVVASVAVLKMTLGDVDDVVTGGTLLPLPDGGRRFDPGTKNGKIKKQFQLQSL